MKERIILAIAATALAMLTAIIGLAFFDCDFNYIQFIILNYVILIELRIND